jgi:hypothetical protein
MPSVDCTNYYVLSIAWTNLLESASAILPFSRSAGLERSCFPLAHYISGRPERTFHAEERASYLSKSCHDAKRSHDTCTMVTSKSCEMLTNISWEISHPQKTSDLEGASFQKPRRGRRDFREKRRDPLSGMPRNGGIGSGQVQNCNICQCYVDCGCYLSRRITDTGETGESSSRVS